MKFAYLSSNVEFANRDLTGLVNYFNENTSEQLDTLIWNETHDYSIYDRAVIGPVWDYSDNRTAFINTCKEISKVTDLVNPLDTITWNSDKIYLEELDKAGITTIPTQYIYSWELEEVLAACKNCKPPWILKPSIGAGGIGMLKTDDIELIKANFDNIPQKGALMVQEFKSVIYNGEASAVFINGSYSHSILKKATKNEYRVQEDHGGTYHLYNPSKKELDFCHKVLEVANKKSGYARVDYLIENSNPILIELELIEPELFLRLHEASYAMILELFRNGIS